MISVDSVVAPLQVENNIVPMLQLIATICIVLIGGYWALFKSGAKNKDDSRDKDLIILKKDLQSEIGREKGRRELSENKLMNEIVSQGKEQKTINKQLKDLIEKVHKSINGQDKKWTEFMNNHARWTDKTNDSIQHLNSKMGELQIQANGVEGLVKNTVDELKTVKNIYKELSKK